MESDQTVGCLQGRRAGMTRSGAVFVTTEFIDTSPPATDMPTELFHSPVIDPLEMQEQAVPPALEASCGNCIAPSADSGGSRFGSWLQGGAVVAILSAAILFRCTALANIPGVNGDEAWYGNLVHDILAGNPRFVTPSQLPVNPFFVAPLLLLHVWFEPSITLLRVPALLSGLAALAVNFWLANRYCDRYFAWLSTLILAVSPLMIAYSRFGWDTAQMPLATVFLLYASAAVVRRPTERNARLVLGAMIVALIVHPTALFLAPLCVWASIDAVARDFPDRFQPYIQWLKQPQALLAGTGAAIFLCIVLHDWRQGSVLPVNSLIRLQDFLSLYADLFSGRTAAIYLSGATGWEPVWILWRLLILAVTGMALAKCLSSPQQEQRILGSGMLLGLAGFMIVGGPAALMPGHERYGMFLLVPTAYLWTYLFTESTVRSKTAIRVGLAGLAIVFLAQFQFQYFDYIRQSGGAAHMTFRTEANDPKVEAARLLKQAANSEQRMVVVTSSFHCYQPLEYLLRGTPGVEVIFARKVHEMEAALKAHSEADLWIVDFVENEQGEVPVALKAGRQGPHLERAFLDYGGRETLVALHASVQQRAANTASNAGLLNTGVTPEPE